MIESFPAIRRAMGADGPAPSWCEIMSELWPIISMPLSPDGERFLLDVIAHRFLLDVIAHEGDIRVAATEELPHSMSPKEMLRSLAKQALDKSEVEP